MYKVIFEDKNLMVIDKPAGLVVTPSQSQKEITLTEILKSQHGLDLERSGIVHRLDKDTSGILLVAKTLATFTGLQRQFKERIIKKEYLALVHGWVEKAGKIEGAIGRNPGNREKFAVLPEGKEAVTEYKPLKKFKINNLPSAEQNSKCFPTCLRQDKIIFENLNKIQLRKLERMNYNQFTLLSCKPLTGRTHQIRVHLKYVGFPIVSDEKYAGRKMARLDKRWCPRMFLHAHKLGFYHPVSGKWMEVESDLPEDLEKALSNLKS